MKVGTGMIHTFWNAATWGGGGLRRFGTLLQKVYPSAYGDTLFFRDDPAVDGIIALTIDDGLVRNINKKNDDESTKDNNNDNDDDNDDNDDYYEQCSMVEEVRQLLKSYNAHATFFVCTDYVRTTTTTTTSTATSDKDTNTDTDTNTTTTTSIISKDAQLLLQDGHEFGNHLQKDVSGYYFRLSKEQFRSELLKAKDFLEKYCSRSCSSSSSSSSSSSDTTKKKTPRKLWFRAPQGIMTPTMKQVLQEENDKRLSENKNNNNHDNIPFLFQHVLGDCYCDDWAFAEAQDENNNIDNNNNNNKVQNVVAPLMLKQIQHFRGGSIVIFHMPQRNFREATLLALQEFLQGIKERGLRCVTLTELMEMEMEMEMEI